MAVHGFAILNTNALPAAEELTRLANDPNRAWSPRAAAKALLTVTNTAGK
jgi:hypothetical protein